MKRCPTCQRSYGDESLNFCLDDGTTLLRIDDSASSRDSGATLVLNDRTLSIDAVPPTQISQPRGSQTEIMPPTAVTAPPETPRYTAREAYVAPPPPKSRSHLLTAGVTAIAVLLLVLVGIGIAMLMRSPADVSEKPPGSTNTGNLNNANTTPPVNANNQNSNVVPPNDETNTRGRLNITASASSTRASIKALTYFPSHVLDGNMQTAWIEGVPGPGIGEWVRCDFDREVKLNNVELTPGYFKSSGLWRQNNRLGAATLYFSDGTSRRFTFPDRMQAQKLATGGVKTRFVRLVIEEFYPGSVDSEDTPISEMSFDWEP